MIRVLEDAAKAWEAVALVDFKYQPAKGCQLRRAARSHGRKRGTAHRRGHVEPA